MSVINRNVTRTILADVEETSKTADINANALAFVLLTSDSFFVGFQDRFSTRFFDMGTVNSNSTVVDIKYFDGTDFTNSVDDIIDQTAGFTQSGFISWVNKGDWVKTSRTGIDTDVELFWIKVEVSVSLSSGTTLQTLLNLFTDDNIVREYYPQLISDTRYLPSGRTNFLEQHKAAKDLVILKLKQKKWIVLEGDVIDINPVAIATVHAFAWIILNPIAFSDESKEFANRAFSDFIRELSQVQLSIDLDQDGIIDTAERKEVIGTSRIVRT